MRHTALCKYRTQKKSPKIAICAPSHNGSLVVKLDSNGQETRYLLQEIAKTAINDARLAPTHKPEVEIWRKLHKRTVLLSVEGELGPNLTQRRLGQGLPPYQVVS